ncbi:MAG: substrate-binding domain-containing protein, partial [Roseiflexaceae bacterium]|nr:substrate-binding domain-containing protein [Roseiflexaceae bacterium]
SELGYPGPSGRGVAAQPSSRALRDIAFLYSPVNEGSSVTTNPFWSHILAGVEREAERANLRLSYRAIDTLRRTPEQLLTAIYDLRASGLLIVGPISAEGLLTIQSTKLPLVVVESYAPRSGIDAVACDSFDGARQAVDYLVSRGHHEIAFISGPADPANPRCQTLYTQERRAEGYRTALADAGVTFDPLLVEPSNLTTEGGYEACGRLLRRKQAFSAIFCANDMAAIGAIKALREAGRSVPDDVSVVGFDDVDMAQHLTPPLTTVRVPKEAIGAAAVQRLQARAADPTAVPSTTLLDVTLVVRQSVRARS